MSEIDYSSVDHLLDSSDLYSIGNTQNNSNDSFEIIKGFKAGIDQTQAMFGGAVAALGDAFGSEKMQQWGIDSYLKNMDEAQAHGGSTTRFSEIDDVGEFFDWLGYSAGNLAPMIATSVAAGGVGGVIARKAVKKSVDKYVQEQIAKGVAKDVAEAAGKKKLTKATRIGQGLGAYESGSQMATGEIYGELIQSPTEGNKAAIAMTHGRVSGLLDAIPAMGILKRLGIGDVASDQIREGVMRSMAKQGFSEGITEGGQAIVEEHAKNWLETNRSLFAPDQWQKLQDPQLWVNVMDSAAAGVVGGGVMGGLSSLGDNRPTAEKMQERKEAAQAAGGDALDQANAASEELVKSAQKVNDFGEPIQTGELRGFDDQGVEAQAAAQSRRDKLDALQARMNARNVERSGLTPEQARQKVREQMDGKPIDPSQPIEFESQAIPEQQAQPAYRENGSEIEFESATKPEGLQLQDNYEYEGAVEFDRTNDLASGVERRIAGQEFKDRNTAKQGLLPSPETTTAPAGYIADDANKKFSERTNSVGQSPMQALMSDRMDSDPAQKLEDRKVKTDKNLHAHTKRVREARLPSNLKDQRLNNPAYRAEVIDATARAEQAIEAAEAQTSGVKVEVDDLMTAIAKNGGISREEMESDGFDWQDLKEQKHKLKRAFHSGGRSLDDMAEALVEDGYLTERDPRMLADMIDDTLRGKQHFSVNVDPDKAKESAVLNAGRELGMTSKQMKTALTKMLNGEELGSRQLEFAESVLGAIESERSDQVGDRLAERAKRNEVRKFNRQVAQAIVDGQDSLGNAQEQIPASAYAEIDQAEFNGYEDVSPADIAEATAEVYADENGLTQAEIDQLSENYPETESYVSAIYREVAKRATANQRTESQSEIDGEGLDTQAQGREVESADDSNGGNLQEGDGAREELLTTYTEEDIAAREAQQAKIKQEEQQAEEKAKADSDLSSFSLTGSDRPADIAEAEGQESLFDELPLGDKNKEHSLLKYQEKIEKPSGGTWTSKWGAENFQKQHGLSLSHYVAGGGRSWHLARHPDIAKGITFDVQGWQEFNQEWGVPVYQYALTVSPSNRKYDLKSFAEKHGGKLVKGKRKTVDGDYVLPAGGLVFGNDNLLNEFLEGIGSTQRVEMDDFDNPKISKPVEPKEKITIDAKNTPNPESNNDEKQGSEPVASEQDTVETESKATNEFPEPVTSQAYDDLFGDDPQQQTKSKKSEPEWVGELEKAEMNSRGRPFKSENAAKLEMKKRGLDGKARVVKGVFETDDYQEFRGYGIRKLDNLVDSLTADGKIRYTHSFTEALRGGTTAGNIYHKLRLVGRMGDGQKVWMDVDSSEVFVGLDGRSGFNSISSETGLAKQDLYRSAQSKSLDGQVTNNEPFNQGKSILIDMDGKPLYKETEWPKSDTAEQAAVKNPVKGTAPEHANVGMDDRSLEEVVSSYDDIKAIVKDISSIFDAPKKDEIVRLQNKVKVYNDKHGWMTPAEARKKIDEWKDHAAAQYDDQDARSINQSKVVLSLFDLTGKWSQPWVDAGYQVYRFDIQDDAEVGDINNFSVQFFGDWFGDFDGADIHAILAACPCTDFASSGARHFAAKDKDGRTVESVKLVSQTLATIEYFKPAVWAIENPVGRIEKLGGLPPWRLSFDPNHLGEDYTKKTLLWGRFNGDLEIAPTEPTAGSKMHTKYGGKSQATKNARSATPEGFAYSFFKANNFVDHTAKSIHNKYDRLDKALIEDAVKAGIDEQEISQVVDDPYYMEMDDDAANNAIKELIAVQREEARLTNDAVSEIDDVGEELTGARKHLAQKELEQFNKNYSDEELAKSTLSKIWPKKINEEINDDFIAAFMHAARAEIPAKPRKSYKLNDWVQKVKVLRGAANVMLEIGDNQLVKEKLSSAKGLSVFAEKVNLLTSLPREDWDRIGKVDYSANAYSYTADGDKQKVPTLFVEIDGRSKFFKLKEDNPESGFNQVKLALANKPEQNNRSKFEVRGRAGSYFINRKGDKEYRKLIEFDDVKKASAYLRENADSLVELWEQVKERDNVKRSDMRRSENRARTGSDHRQGKDISAEEFKSAFGFRGVQFGNWVKQGKGGKDRQGLVNRAYDALMDLSEILDVPAESLSLDGKLGIAFGARGSGNAAAHYEPGTVVINLTKTSGAGSLAHEWFHALDHYFTSYRDRVVEGKYGNFMTHSAEPLYVNKGAKGRFNGVSKAQLDRYWARSKNEFYDPKNWEQDPSHPKGVRPEVERRFAEVVDVLSGSPMAQRSGRIDKGKADGYWSRMLEMSARAFEIYVVEKMEGQGYHNDFLVNIAKTGEFRRSLERYPYPLPSEMKEVRDAFDGLFDEIKTKQTSNGIALFSLNSRSDSVASNDLAVSREDAEAVVARITSDWVTGDRDVILVDSFDALPTDIKEEAEKQGAANQINGVFHNDKLYLVRDMHKNEQALEETIFHEAFGHYGLRKLFGKVLDAKLNELYLAIGGEKGIARFGEKHGFDAGTRKMYSDSLIQTGYPDHIKKAVLVDEMLAHMAQHSKPGIKRRIKELIGMVRAWLRKHGFAELKKMDDNDIFYLLQRSRNAMKNVDTQSSNGVPMFSRVVDNPEVDDALDRLGLNPKERQSLLKKIMDFLKELWENKFNGEWSVYQRAYEGMFDGMVGLKRAEKEVGIEDAAQSGYVGARLATGVADVMHAVLHYGAPEWKDGILQHKEGTQGLLEILSDLGSDLDAWLAWMGANRAQELMDQGRENNLTQEDIDALKAKANGKEELFQDIKQRYNALNTAMLDMSQEAGLIKGESRSQWESEWYVPFYRQSDADGNDAALLGPRTKRGLSHQSAGIKALKGGEVPTNDLLENILQNWIKLTDSAMKNMALLKAVDNLKDSRFMSNESMRFEQAAIPRSEVNKRIKSDRAYREQVAEFLGFGRDAKVNKVINELASLDNDSYEKMWAITAPVDPDVIRVTREGKNEYYRVHDDSVLRAVMHMNTVGSNDPITKTGRYFKRLLTTGVTASPDFILRNFVRDAVHAWAINPDGFKFAKDSYGGLKNALKEDEDYRKLMFAGASFQGGYVHGTDPERSAQIVRRALQAKGLSQPEIERYESSILNSGAKLTNAVNQGWEWYKNKGDKVENANRLATFKKALESGKSMAQASFESKDLMDYSMRGNFQALIWFTDVIPFLNARMQGLNKLGRAAKENPQRLKSAGFKIAAFSMALALLNDEEERYEQLPDWDKDANWHFFIGEHHFRIPKPFEIGIMFGTMPERMAHVLMGNQDSEKLAWSLKHNILHTLNVNPIPQFAMPVAEVVANRSFFFDSPIEGMADEGKLPEARYNERTSTTMVELGKAADWLGLSPKQLQHLYNGYLGTMGMYGLMLSDVFVEGMTGKEKPAWGLEDYPVVKSFYKGAGPAKSTQFATDFYDRLSEVEETYRTIQAYRKEGKFEEANELRNANMDKLKYRGALGRARKQLGDLNKQIERVSRNKSISKEMKRVQIQRLQKRKNEVAKRIADLTS